MRRIPKNIWIFVYLLCTGLFSLLIATTVGLFELPDGYFYVVIGQYLLTGFLLPVFPFNTTKPQTLFGPIYGLITAPLFMLPHPWGMTILVFIQVYGIFVSALLLYFLAKTILGKKLGLPTALLFLSFPFALPYASTLMTESITTLFTTIYISVAMFFVTKKRTFPVSIVVLLAVILTLTKNVYIFLVLLSLVFWVLIRIKYKRKDIVPVAFVRSSPAIIGFFFLFLWMAFNHFHHGVWTTTINTGRHLFNNVVWQGRMLPPDDSPTLKMFVDRAGSKNNIFQPEWEAQRFFINDFQSGKMTEVDMDNAFKKLSIEAIKAQPLAWVLNAIGVGLGDMVNPPYHKTMLTMMGLPDAQCPECVERYCRIVWNRNLCMPMSPNPTMIRLWGYLLIIERFIYYPYLMFALVVFGFIGTIHAIIKKNIPLIVIAFLYYFFIFGQGAAQMIEGRYLLPLYPLYALLVIAGVNQTISLFRHVYVQSLENSEEWKASMKDE